MSYNETTGIIEVESNKQKYVSSVGVYNFEVENTHSYFVGENRVWVHNYGRLITFLSRYGGRIVSGSMKLLRAGYNYLRRGGIPNVPQSIRDQYSGPFERIIGDLQITSINTVSGRVI